MSKPIRLRFYMSSENTTFEECYHGLSAEEMKFYVTQKGMVYVDAQEQQPCDISIVPDWSRTYTHNNSIMDFQTMDRVFDMGIIQDIQASKDLLYSVYDFGQMPLIREKYRGKSKCTEREKDEVWELLGHKL